MPFICRFFGDGSRFICLPEMADIGTGMGFSVVYEIVKSMNDAIQVHSETMTNDRIQSLGIKGLLRKPIVTRDLVKKVREVLDKTEQVSLQEL